MEKLNELRDWVFRQMHSKNLVYNACWEDPRCDRQLMEIDRHSEIVMITSAGCNALDYLLDTPARIHCIDVNPRQNALLQLKLAAFRHGSFDDLFQLFGKGIHKGAKTLIQQHLQEHLSPYAQRYWNKNQNFFSGRGLRKTFYHYSTSGTLAWMTNQYLKTQKNLYNRVQQMFDAPTLEEQAGIYYEIEPKLLNKLVEWAFNRHVVMSLAGVPRTQQELFVDKYDRGALGYVQECLRKVFAQQSLHDNYFWRLYLNGSYTETCCPSYLKQQNFDTIRQQADKVHTHTCTISQFLEANPGKYSNYVLLDHQDWLADNNRPALEEEWRLILQNSRPGTRILLRSAAHEVDFFPDFVLNAIEFEQEKTAETHQQDRVGTYASVYLGIVK